MKYFATALFSLLFAICLLFAKSASAQFNDLLDSATDLGSDSLTSMLSSQLGADQSQIEGGLGSLFSLASEKLSAGDFDKLGEAIPGVSKYIDSAKQLGVLDAPLTNMAGLDSALGQLGMSPDMISEFLPMAVDALGKVGGSDIQGMLQSLLTAS